MISDSKSDNRNSDLTRRQFVGTTAALAAGVWVAEKASAAKGPNDNIGVGFIGTGSRGNNHLSMVNWMKQQGDNVQVVAVCDIYKPRLDKAAQTYNAKSYTDYRELLADKNVDVVCIATPDHHHAYQAIDAIKAGKDIYCEKPVTHWDQFEITKKLADLAAKSDCVFQLGTQAMSDSVWHQMKRLVQVGMIGRPVFGETSFFRLGDWGEVGMPIDDPNAKPGPDLNWKAFLGDRKKKPFTVDRFFRWRLFEDYAGGPVTDIYPHCLTQVIDILGVGMPESVVALGGIHRFANELRDVPDSFNLLAQYPEKVTVSVIGSYANDYNSLEGHRGSGSRMPTIRGWDGSLSIHQNKEIVFTPLRVQGAKKPQRFPIERAEDNVQHWRNLIECCRSRDKKTWSPMDLAFKTQTVLQMAMLSHKKESTAKFDPDAREIKI